MVNQHAAMRPSISRSPGVVMVITVEAVVENGLLRPMQPLPLKENEQVRITIEASLPLVRGYLPRRPHKILAFSRFELPTANGYVRRCNGLLRPIPD